jgi:hypothetical protein
MKIGIVSAALSLLVGATAFGQTPSPPAPVEPETLTAGASPDGTRVSGWFVAPSVGTTVFGDGVQYTPGLRAGLYLNKRFAVGVAAQGLVSSNTVIDANEVRNLGSYGGLLVQYVWRSDQLIHASIESTIGDGRWCGAEASGSDSCASKRFLVLEPAANLEINLARHVRLASGVGYRLAVGGGGEGPSSRDMSGLLVRTSLVLGSF